jgi:hydroxyethylthiazole kinase
MDVYPFLEAVRQKSPVVHHLTNWVTIYDCAQVVKSLGASPVMAHAVEEVADMTGLASALGLNIGTLTEDFVEGMKKAARAANYRNIPVVLDVCGAGATAFRDRKSLEILDAAHIGIIKGNGSEIARISGLDVRTKGVDAAHVGEDLSEIAQGLAEKRTCTVVITGKVDIVTDGTRICRVRNGVELMSQVVGTGCMAASVMGAFAGASPFDMASAAAAGLCCYGVAAELAALKARTPVSFKHQLLDEIFSLGREDIARLQKVDG